MPETNGRLVDGQKVDVLRMVDWLFRLASLVLLTILVALWGEMNKLHDDVVAIQINLAEVNGNRYTVVDHNAFAEVVWAALADKPDADQVPPAWFLSRVDAIEVRIHALEGRQQ